MKSAVFWIVTPCSSVENQRFAYSIKIEEQLFFACVLVSCLVYSSTQKKEAKRFSEISVDLHPVRRLCNPEDESVKNV
jgi:hypothetical protein